MSVAPTIVALFAGEATGAYAIETENVIARAVRTNNPVAAPMRGYGCFQIGFAMERLMDRVAERLGADPIELRRRHLKHGPDGPLGAVLDRARAVHRNPPEPPPGWLAGRGLALGHVKCGYPFGMVDRTVAEVAVDSTGAITVASDIPDAGTGMDRSAGEAVRRALGLWETPTYRVAAAFTDDPTGDTLTGRRPSRLRRGTFAALEWWLTTGLGGAIVRASALPPGVYRRLIGAGRWPINLVYRVSNGLKYRLFPFARDTANPRVSGSRGMLLFGRAVGDAARAFAQRVRHEAAPALGAAPDSLTLGPDGVTAPDGAALSWARLAERAGGRIAALGVADNAPGFLLGQGGNQSGPTDFMDACHVCDVAVEPTTGKVRVLAYTGVHDAGRVHNEALVRGQVQGGLLMGLGQAVGEVSSIDGGRVATTSLRELAVPTALDAPEAIEIDLVETGTGRGPDGAKGIGEAAAVAAPAALASAVSAATGAPVVWIPLAQRDVFALADDKEPVA